MHILVVEDDAASAEMVTNALRESGHEVTMAANGREAFSLIRSGQFRMVVSDWRMPEMSGLELCRQIRQRHGSGYVYVILLSANAGTRNIVDGLSAGADDYVTKPFHPQELNVRVRAGERILSLEPRDLTIFALAKLAESRDPETGAHLERIQGYCRLVAAELAQAPNFSEQVDGDFAEMLHLTSPLHDIGKVGIPDDILLKPGPLSPAEWEVMKRHTVIGAQTLDSVLRVSPDSELLLMGRDIAWTHHERFDGTGYPRGLAGSEIPLCGRIVALADVYDAMTTRRVYKTAFSHRVATDFIRENRGRRFDPDIVDAFVRREGEVQALKQRLEE